MKTILITILLLLTTKFFCQSNQRVEDSIHIYWQPKMEIKKEDFKFDGTKEKNAELYCQKLKLCTSAATNINIIIDVPIDSTSKEFEKIYIVPLMEKTKSYMFGDDKNGILYQKIVFDIEEWTARYTRQQLEKTFTEFSKHPGSISTWYKIVLNDARKKKTELIDQYTMDLFIQPQSNAYKIWRSRVSHLLKNLKKYSTSLEECQRFLNHKPLDNNYKQLIFLGDENH